MVAKAQFEATTIDEKNVVQFNGRLFNMESHLEIPEGESTQKYLSKLIFSEEDSGLKEAYDAFLKLWKLGNGNADKTGKGKIVIDLRKIYELEGRFACYHLSASLSGTVNFSGLPPTTSAKKMKDQFFLLTAGVEKGFIHDIQKQEILELEQILAPTVAEGIKNMFGADMNLYAEDKCLQFYTKEKDGRFLYNEITQKHFTDYFKQLVGWGEWKDCDTPQFIHGQKGLESYFRNNKFSLAYDNAKADTVEVSLIVLEDGTPIQPTIERKSDYYNEKKLLDLCAKMPKWIPAYQDGRPIKRETSFTLRVPNIYDVVEIMPTFRGGDAALMQYLAQAIKYPEVAVQYGIQGRVVCTFVVEKDGSVIDVTIVKSVDPVLDEEAVRVLRNMPKWIPGQKGGVPVRVKYTVPVTFRL